MRAHSHTHTLAHFNSRTIELKHTDTCARSPFRACMCATTKCQNHMNENFFFQYGKYLCRAPFDNIANPWIVGNFRRIRGSVELHSIHFRYRFGLPHPEGHNWFICVCLYNNFPNAAPRLRPTDDDDDQLANCLVHTELEPKKNHPRTTFAVLPNRKVNRVSS